MVDRRAPVSTMKLGILRLVTGEEPRVLNLRSGSEPSAPAAILTDPGVEQILVWHSSQARVRPGGPDRELRNLEARYASHGWHLDHDHAYALSGSRSEIRVVWPIDARGLARWEVRTHLLAQGRWGWAKRWMFLAFGDRLARRLRVGTLVRIERRYAR
jgi:hypothetical protein